MSLFYKVFGGYVACAFAVGAYSIQRNVRAVNSWKYFVDIDYYHMSLCDGVKMGLGLGVFWPITIWQAIAHGPKHLYLYGRVIE